MIVGEQLNHKLYGSTATRHYIGGVYILRIKLIKIKKKKQYIYYF